MYGKMKLFKDLDINLLTPHFKHLNKASIN